MYTTKIITQQRYARWWDYSAEFLNLDGRICLKLSIFFGLVGLFVIYVITQGGNSDENYFNFTYKIFRCNI